ncbi:retrovirus-related pol polyprotein from transposon TNT 1-94 [Tanacetum coccineum]
MMCPQHYLTKMQEVILFYNGLDVPTRQILYPKGAIPTKTTADAKVAIQKMSKYSKKWPNGISRIRSTETFDGLAAIQAQLNNLGKEIKKVNEKVYAAQNSRLIFESRQMTILFLCRLNDYYYDGTKGSYGLQCLNAHSYGVTRVDDSLSRKEKDPRSFTLPCYINNVCFKNALVDLAASVSVMPLSSYLNLGLGELAHTKLTVELADRIVKHLKGIAENVLVGIGKFVFPVDFIILDIPEDVKVPLILGRPFFLRERIELDLEARLMGETLVLNRSLDPLYGDYIDLNNLNVPLELRRDQVDDLMPTIEEGEVFDEPMIDIIKTRNNESFNEYPSFCDFDWKIHIDGAYNLKFSCMIGFEHVNANFFPLLSANVMSREFYNSIMKDKVEYKGKNVWKNMDGYRDQDMGDIIFGETLCKASCVEAKRFNGLITIHNGPSIRRPRWKKIDKVGEVSIIWNSCL